MLNITVNKQLVTYFTEAQMFVKKKKILIQ